jgi:hypothetical protein
MLMLPIASAIAAHAGDTRAATPSLDGVVQITAYVPQEARTAASLGTERQGTGVVIDNNGLILTIGYLVLEAEHPGAVGVVANHLDIATGLLTLVPLLLLALAAITLGIQHLDGWLAPPAHPFAIGLLVAAVLWASALLTTWDYARPNPPDEISPDASRTQAGDLHVHLEVDREAPWRAPTPLTAVLTVTGPPNATVTLKDLTFTGPHVTVTHDLATPTTIHLERIEQGDGRIAPDNETYGIGTLTLEATATPHRISTLIPMIATVTLDGHQATLASDLPAFDWATPATPALAAAAIPLALAGATAAIAPRRWNRW